MNSSVILALISDLYSQLNAAHQQIQTLSEELASVRQEQ